MRQAPYTYETDTERVQACHEREKTMTWIAEHVEDIIKVHEKVKQCKKLDHAQRNLLDILLQSTVTNVFHAQAEQEYCLRVLGVTIAKKDEQHRDRNDG